LKFYFIVYLRILWIVEISNNNNQKIDYLYRDEHDDDRNASSSPEHTKAITQDPSNIESEVCAEVFMMSQNNSQSIPYHDTSYGNKKTNVTSNNSIDTSM